MSTRREEQRDNYRDGKDLKYATPVIVPALFGALKWARRKLLPFDELESRNGAEEDDRAVRRQKHHNKRSEDIGVDMATGLALGGINHYSIGKRKQEVVDTFGTIVAAELSTVRGVHVDSSQLTFNDLKASDNVLVQEALLMHKQQFRRSYATNIISMGGALLPLAENVKDYLRGGRATKDAEGADGAVIENEESGFSKKLKADGTIDYDVKSGYGTPLYLGANAIYFFTDRATRGQNSYDAIQDLRSEVELAKQGKEIDSYLLTKVYNNFVDEFAAHYPTFVSPDLVRERSFFQKMTDGLRKAIPFISNPEQEAPPFPNAPKSVKGIGDQDSAMGDPISRGAFEYMAESMTRSYDNGFKHNGRDLNFTVDVFLAMIGDGWVDVDHPQITEFVAKICANKGLEGLQHIESHLAARRAELNMEDLPVEQVIEELQGMYRAAIIEKLREVPAVADQVVLKVAQPEGEQLMVLDSVKTAELIGAKRLKSYLNLPYQDDPEALVKRHPEYRQPMLEAVVSATQLDVLRAKVSQRATEKESDKFKMLTEAESRHIIEHFADPISPEQVQALLATNQAPVQTVAASPVIAPSMAPDNSQDMLRVMVDELKQLRQAQQQTQQDSQAMLQRVSQLEHALLAAMPAQAVDGTVPDQELLSDVKDVLTNIPITGQKH